LRRRAEHLPHSRTPRAAGVAVMAEDEFVPLTHEILSQCLSQIQLVVGGGGFAFTRLDCSDKELTDLGNKVEDYHQLRHVVLSNNKLTDISKVTQLPHVLTLHADNNQVASLACVADGDGVNLPWCQRLDLSSNKLQALPSLSLLERLRFAHFGSNEISSLEGFGDHPALEELHLQENQLTTLKGLGCLESLKRLVVSSNQLTSLEGLDAPCLTHADLGKNQLASLAHIDGIPACIELDLKENQLNTEDPNLPELRRLGSELRKLRTVHLAGNPSDLRVEAVVCIPQVTQIDEDPVSEEDREAAKTKAEELVEAVRAYEEEKARLAAEAAAEAEAAAAAAAAEGAAEEE